MSFEEDDYDFAINRAFATTEMELKLRVLKAVKGGASEEARRRAVTLVRFNRDEAEIRLMEDQ